MQRKLCMLVLCCICPDGPRKAGKGKGKVKKGQEAKQARKVPVMQIEGTGLALPSAASFGAASSLSSSQQKGNSLTLHEELGLTPDKKKCQGNHNLTPTTEKMSRRLGNG
eukprot:67762-Rhodomonas_salina.1